MPLRTIYSRAGRVLVAMNPFDDIHDEYTDEVMDRYSSVNPNAPPHIFEVAARVF